MDLVLDANILFAAFIKDSTTRGILLTKTPLPLKLYTTPFILEETYKYRKLLAKKTSLDKNEIMELVLELMSASNIEIIKEKELNKFKTEARRISPMENDSSYFTVALYKNCKIWSNDKLLKDQDIVDVITTKELLALLTMPQ